MMTYLTTSRGSLYKLLRYFHQHRNPMLLVTLFLKKLFIAFHVSSNNPITH